MPQKFPNFNLFPCHVTNPRKILGLKNKIVGALDINFINAIWRPKGRFLILIIIINGKWFALLTWKMTCIFSLPQTVVFHNSTGVPFWCLNVHFSFKLKQMLFMPYSKFFDEFFECFHSHVYLLPILYQSLVNKNLTANAMCYWALTCRPYLVCHSRQKFLWKQPWPQKCLLIPTGHWKNVHRGNLSNSWHYSEPKNSIISFMKVFNQ